jgi:GTP cyclohydrolase II/3,4-dihydroxy 2-butanone 4-phosphate synthase/GTP cyclohydrolase II
VPWRNGDFVSIIRARQANRPAYETAVPAPLISRYAEALVPTRAGALRVVVYRSPTEGPEKEHVALVAGELAALSGEDVLARVHSECWTGETLHSLKCDCREQLDSALEAIVAAGRGVVVYLRQEGRGIGLGNKIRAYALQEKGADTVEANEALGFAADLRSYELAAAILDDLGVRSVALMTNNSDKLRGLESAGVRVSRRVPHWVARHEHNQDYLEVKRAKLGHLE